MVPRPYGTSGFAHRRNSSRLLLCASRRARRSCKENALGRLFFGFPRGWAGMTLLVLRAVFGGALWVEGACYVASPNPAVVDWVVALCHFFAGALLLIGLLTPLIAALVAAGAMAVWLSLIPACRDGVFDSTAALVFGFTMLLSIAGLGPGAFSLDARMFGRREIIIPPRQPQFYS